MELILASLIILYSLGVLVAYRNLFWEFYENPNLFELALIYDGEAGSKSILANSSHSYAKDLCWFSWLIPLISK